MFGKHKGQETVKHGTYVNIKTGELVSFGKEGGTLPGETRATFIDIPLLLMMAFGPVLGLMFILFLPAAGVAVMLAFIFKAVTGGLADMKRGAIKSAAPAAIGVAYLQGTGKSGEDEDGKTLEEKADEVEGLILELEEEIRHRRGEGQR